MDHEQRLALELKRARDLQAAFLPRRFAPVPGLETAVICEPAFELTGDFYDCAPLALYEVGLFIADVRGKGIAAAIVQGMVRALFHAEAPKHHSPTPVLRALNQLMYQDLEPESFLTAAYVVLNLERRQIRLARAGHEALLMAAPGGGVRRILPEGMGLGMDNGDIFQEILEEVSLDIEPGCLLVLYTDGAVDTENEAGEPFGLDRLSALIDRPQTPVSEIADGIRAALTTHRGRADPTDDITVLLARIAAE